MDSAASDERLPVWKVLSEFFLDSELDADDYDRIAECLAGSCYAVGQLEEILSFEVYPACKWNIFSVSGVWDFFDEDWIMQNIAPRKDKRRFLALPPLHRWMFKHHWTAVSHLIEQKRSASDLTPQA